MRCRGQGAGNDRSGEVGGAVQSRVFTLTGVLTADADAGVVATQAVVDVSYGPKGIALLKQGLTPDAIIKAIWESDPDPVPDRWTKQGRQFAVINLKGETAPFTGPKATTWAGGKQGKYCTAQGNILAGPEVVDAMVKAFEETTGHLSLRLMAALTVLTYVLAGIAKLRAKAVSFGASDVAPAEADLNAAGLLLFPVAITGVTPVTHVPRVERPLRLTGEVLAAIFLGEITEWDDARIAQLNPGVALPKLPIKAVVRADGSGSTYNFADYLAKVSPAWRQSRGVKSTLAWPASFTQVAMAASMEVCCVTSICTA